MTKPNARFVVVPRRQLPVTLPVFPTLTLWLVLDRLAVPPLVRGIVYTLLAGWWALVLTAWAVQQPRSVWPDDVAEAETPPVRFGGRRDSA